MTVARRGRQALALALWGAVIFAVAALIGAGETLGQETQRAALIVDFGKGQVQTSCVDFSEDQITGADLLRRSGLAVVFSSFGGGLGAGVCQIDGQGCSDPGDCFCACRGADCRYWSYWTLRDGEWHYEARGASARDVRDGDIDVWVWGDGNTPPAPSTFADICPTILPAAPTQAHSAPVLPATDGSDGPALAPQVVGPAVTEPTPEATAAPEPTERVARPAPTRPPPNAVDASNASRGDGGSNGAPIGLIAFGVVAALLVAGIGGVALRRRFGG